MLKLINRIFNTFGYRLQKIRSSKDTKEKLILLQKELKKIALSELKAQDLDYKNPWVNVNIGGKNEYSSIEDNSVTVFESGGTSRVLTLLAKEEYYTIKEKK